MRRSLRTLAVSLLAAALTAVFAAPAARAQSDFRTARPASILVLPPLNETPDTNAGSAVWAHVTRPVAEAGYYVVPVTLVDESFRQNGVLTPSEAQAVPFARLREQFGADAALYLRVTAFGGIYRVVSTEIVVEVSGRLVDLRDGTVLWEGAARVADVGDAPTSRSAGGMIAAAVARQLMASWFDAAAHLSEQAATRLVDGPDGFVRGARSPRAGQSPPGVAGAR